MSKKLSNVELEYRFKNAMCYQLYYKFMREEIGLEGDVYPSDHNDAWEWCALDINGEPIDQRQFPDRWCGISMKMWERRNGEDVEFSRVMWFHELKDRMLSDNNILIL